ncbi:MAG: division plane positioning ATPase MipZ [Alphaproteobacteria bacterium]
MTNQESGMPKGPSCIIVFGNQKGGSGKSTAAMHTIVGLLRMGYSVGSIDLDGDQGTLTNYFRRRQERAEIGDMNIPCPTHMTVHQSQADTMTQRQAEEQEALDQALIELSEVSDAIVIDTPGQDNFLSRLGHSYADVLVTPINDSFVDLDLLAKIDPETFEVQRPSTYAEMVWDQRKRRALRRQKPIDWIVMRNRVGHHEAKNKRDIGAILTKLEQRIGFRLAPGFGERVIFRELYLKGLTLLDMHEQPGFSMSMSHIAARNEVRTLLDVIGVHQAIEEERKRMATAMAMTSDEERQPIAAE